MSKKSQRVPPMTPLNKNVGELGFVAVGEGYEVCSYSTGTAWQGVPPTEVHLLIKATPEVTVALRMKSAGALDELVGVLLQHRADVWGQ